MMFLNHGYHCVSEQISGDVRFSCLWYRWPWFSSVALWESVPVCAAASPLRLEWECSISSQVSERNAAYYWPGFNHWLRCQLLLGDGCHAVSSSTRTGLGSLGSVCCFLAGMDLLHQHSTPPEGVEGSMGWSLYLALISFPLQMMAATLFLWAAKSHRKSYTRMTAYRVA